MKAGQQSKERPTLAGVVGFPVAHSRSPAMHNAAFDALGLRWRYLKLPVPAERLGELLRALPGSGFRGVNVTIPHKLAALAAADNPTAAAAAIGAANSLTFEDAGIEADNTDAGGFLDALAEPPAGTVLVLGAGGAARAVAFALRDAGVSDVLVWNRTRERARALATELGVGHAERPKRADILVNATSVGLSPQIPEADALEVLGLAGLAPPPVVVDLVYGDAPTPVAAWAARGGSRVVEGLEVLVRQGARSFRRWTGREAPLDVMRAAAGAPGAHQPG